MSETANSPRVTTVQAEARAALRLAVGFAVAGGVAVVVPHGTGSWLPLHLFLVGALGLALSGATRLFAVTWSAGSPSHPALVAAQRRLLAVGAGGLAVGRELDAPSLVLAAFGLCVTGALVLLALVWLAGAVVVTAAGELVDAPVAAGAGLLAYAGGLLHLLTALPRPGRKQLVWAGPRLVLLGAGLLWWAGTVVVAGLRVLAGGPAFAEPLVVALVVGGYAQILLGSLAYLGPVLRGGGHRHLGAGFATTRSWVAVAAANLGGLAWVAGRPALTAAASTVLAADLAWRSIRLARTRAVPDPQRETVDV